MPWSNKRPNFIHFPTQHWRCTRYKPISWPVLSNLLRTSKPCDMAACLIFNLFHITLFVDSSQRLYIFAAHLKDWCLHAKSQRWTWSTWSHSSNLAWCHIQSEPVVQLDLTQPSFMLLEINFLVNILFTKAVIGIHSRSVLVVFLDPCLRHSLQHDNSMQLYAVVVIWVPFFFYYSYSILFSIININVYLRHRDYKICSFTDCIVYILNMTVIFPLNVAAGHNLLVTS